MFRRRRCGMKLSDGNRLDFDLINLETEAEF